MTNAAGDTHKPARKGGKPGWAGIAVAAVCIWLGWQVVLGPISQRAPASAAVTLNPGSPLVLRRAAEEELVAERRDNAGALARQALARSPFDIKALRVIGLVEDLKGRTDQADQILTLAGNWSLRDDPTHTWLINQRLRQGNYLSAFGHADTLVRRGRRRDDVFNLFTTAGVQYPQTAPALARVLELDPIWRGTYLRTLYRAGPDQAMLATRLGLMLQSSEKPLTDEELSQLYAWYLKSTTPGSLAAIRARFGRPTGRSDALVNGDFDQAEGIAPFTWKISQEPGATVVFSEGPDGADRAALRVSYDGLGADGLIEQFLVLSGGPLTLTGRMLEETPGAAQVFSWRLACSQGRSRMTPRSTTVSDPDANGWRQFSVSFAASASCPGQWLQLGVAPVDQRVSATLWIDDLTLGG